MIKILLLLIIHFLSSNSYATDPIKIPGELKALNTDNFSPPRVEGIWQYTISFMAEDGSVIKEGMPVLMFKTDEINRKLMESQGKLAIKQSEVKNNKANNLEVFEKKAISVEEKKMELEKAKRKAELPRSVLANNDYEENQLRLKLARLQYDSSKVDYTLSQQKSKTDEQILQAEITKLNNEIAKFRTSITKMNIFAKSKGIVIHKTNWQGEKYAVGDSIWGNRRIVEIANLNKIIAKIKIPENNIKYVDLNDKVKVKLDSLPDKDFYGKVTTIEKVVRMKSKRQPSKILEATVEIENVDTEVMRPGMRLSATIFEGSK